MSLQPVVLSKARIQLSLSVFYLICILMGGILVVKWFPQFYAIFPGPFYLTLHTIIEFCGVVISTAVFLLAWYNFQQTRSIQELIICLTFLALGIISFAHALSYNGMPDFFSRNSVNKASTYWILGRLTRAVGMAAAVLAKPIVLKRVRGEALRYLVPTVTVVTAALIFIASDPGFLPPMYVPGIGQTGLKVILEYIGVALETMGLIYLLTRKQRDSDGQIMEASLLFLIFSSVAFTMYSNAYDTYNLIGHIYMITAFILILRRLFVGSVVRLYEANRVLEEQKKKLAEVNGQLEHLNQLKSEFLANTNHELRTPLTSIIGFTEMLLDKETGPLNEIQKDYLMEINDSSQRLMVDINNLLDLSKLEGGQMRAYIQTGSLDEVISEVLRQFKPIFRQKNQYADLRLPEDLPKVPMDREKVKKVLINLLSNAHKFSPDGTGIGIQVEVREDRESLVVSVSDEGTGLTPTESENIFEKFYQAQNTSTRRHDGTGLGLTLAKHFVELHGGDMWVVSSLGQGSNFNFTLPLELRNQEVV